MNSEERQHGRSLIAGLTGFMPPEVIGTIPLPKIKVNRTFKPRETWKDRKARLKAARRRRRDSL